LYKIAIVDDEAVMRMGLRHIVDWQQLGFDIAVEAIDGQDALQKIKETSVDVVITDINMSKMDGIELLKELKKQKLCAYTIFLTGFGEFKYAQKGIELGIYDYLLKPMEPEKIREVFMRIFEDLEKNKKEEHTKKMLLEKYKFSIYMSREKIIYDMLRGKELRYISLEELFDEYKIPFVRSKAAVAVIEVDDFDFNAERWVSTQKDVIIIDKIKAIIQEIFDSYQYMKYILVDGDIGSINLIFQPSEEIYQRDINLLFMGLLNACLNKIRKEAVVKVTIGVGKIYDDIKLIHRSYREAKEALLHKHVIGKSRLIHIEQLEGFENKAYIYPIEKKQLLISYISLGDDRAKEIACKFFDELYDSISNDIDKLNKEVIEIYQILYKQIEKSYKGLVNVYDFNSIIDGNYIINNAGDLKNNFINVISKIISAIKEYKLDCNDSIINKACEYVLEHIMENITLSSISDFLSISKNYFCALFKQETGQNFLDYLTKAKMDKAKILLKSTNMKIYEISSMLGYGDTAYFTKLFKKYVGYTPAEYKKFGL
jgi:two-component system response regulator YesN